MLQLGRQNPVAVQTYPTRQVPWPEPVHVARQLLTIWPKSVSVTQRPLVQAMPLPQVAVQYPSG